ncbi:uncharacterized protein K02A2.6-like [Dermacentor silvarum]|uniref:uncharacterized protein K02A2.6-like n=1 Tax=Dermacentor silvarum TaxID=543639 RepID=UPI001898F7CB|nr:uncharacterized protein K02A2.6-like [Dermacentor silvarum]
MVHSCQVCQEHQRASRHLEITPLPFPERPWSRLHVDFGERLQGPLLPDSGGRLFEVDGGSACHHSFSSRDYCGAERGLHCPGLPEVIVSDNGPAFSITQHLAWLTENGIHRMMVPPYHPASNAERVVQTIKDKLKQTEAADFRTEVLLQYRTTPHDVTGRAPWELLLGRMVKTPLDVLQPDLRSTALLKELKQKLAAD